VLVCPERRVLPAGGWFVLREKYGWLVADTPSEQADYFAGLLLLLKEIRRRDRVDNFTTGLCLDFSAPPFLWFWDGRTYDATLTFAA
jgi:hypothetical protein